MMDGVTQTSKVCLPLLPGPPCLLETDSSCYPAGHVWPILCSAPPGCPLLMALPGFPLPAPAGCALAPVLSPSRVLEAGLPSPQNFWLQAHLPSFVAPPVELMVRTTRLQLIQDIVLSPCEAVLETCGDSAGASHLTSQHSQVARY